MPWGRLVLIAAASYLLGSLNGSLLVSHTFLKVDIRDFGSGNAGTTNALRVMGKKWALLVTLIDLSKGAAAVLLGYYLLRDIGEASLGKLLAGVFVIAGHIFPVFFRFKGGKGVMTTAAIVAFVDWRVFLIVLAVFIAAVLITRWVSLGSVLAAFGVPLGMYLFHQNEGWDTVVLTVLSAVVSLIIVVMHRDNLKRILKGEERRLSFKGRAMLDTVKTKTADITHKTAGAIRQTSKKLYVGAAGINSRRKVRKASKRKRRKARGKVRMNRLKNRPKRRRRNERGGAGHTT